MTLPLTNGGFTQIDESDYDLVSQRSWHFDGRYVRSSTKKPLIRLHVYLLGKREGFEIDHINGNGLDNRRSNLRLVSHQQNIRNSKIRTDSKTGYKGVHFMNVGERVKRWVARITVNGKQKSLGYYHTAQEASEAYAEAKKSLI